MSVVVGGEKCNLITGYASGEDNEVIYGKNRWLAQTFTLDDLYVIFRCRFKSWTNTGGEFHHYALRNTNGAGKPLAVDISHTTLSPGNESFRSPGKWRRFDFGDFPNLPAGTYALVTRVPTVPDWLRYKLRCDATASTYPLGKAWLSHNAGTDWEEIPNTDFMFEIWGWKPPPVANPTPVINNWAPLAIDHPEAPAGHTIVITTDIPVHLYMRWTDKEPLKHPSTEIRRGILIQTGTRFCFVAWHENEQEEPGDTLVHTFIKPGWKVCETRWFYFIGTKQAEESPSASPLFYYHLKEKEIPMLKELSYYDSDLSSYDNAYGLYHWSTGFISPIACRLYFVIMRMAKWGTPPVATVYIKHADAQHKPVGPILAEADFDPTELTVHPRYLHKFIELPHIELEAGREYRICLKCPLGIHPVDYIQWPKHDMYPLLEHQTRTWGSDDGGITWTMGETPMGYDYDIYGFY